MKQSAGDAIVVAEGLRKRFGRTEALRGLERTGSCFDPDHRVVATALGAGRRVDRGAA